MSAPERDLVPSSPTALSPAASGAGALGNLQVHWTTDTEVWWTETGRIRMGYSTPGRRGGKQPHTLDHFRLTSPQREVIEELAGLYGGKPEPWPAEQAPYGIAQWQVIVEADWLDVQVPEVKAGSSQYELWDTPPDQDRGPTVCLRVCDGQYEAKSDQGCICLAEGVWEATQAEVEQGDGEEYVLDPSGTRACKRITRVNLVFSQGHALGVWRLQTTGKTAGNQLTTFMRYWLPRMAPYARLQVGITTVPRPYKDGDGWRVALVRVPTLRAHPTHGETAGQLLTGQGVPAAVAEVAARATDASGGAPGADAAPPSGAGPGPGDGTPAAAPTAPPPGNQASSIPAAGQGVPREAEAGAGRPEPSTPPPHPPGRPEEGPVVAACMNAGLALGTARLYLTTQLPALFGKQHGQHQLHSIAELATIPGDPQDRRSLAWAALDALRGQFVGMEWPAIPEGG